MLHKVLRICDWLIQVDWHIIEIHLVTEIFLSLKDAMMSDGMVGILIGLLAVVFLCWMMISSGSTEKVLRSEQDLSPAERDANQKATQNIGITTGLMGGSIKDAFRVQYALNRAKGDTSKADLREIATGVAMQNEADL
jgi:hypothetical protein